MADDTFNPERLAIAFQAESDNLILAILNVNGGGFGTVLETAGWIKSDAVYGRLQ
jgi:hypothetical protein